MGTTSDKGVLTRKLGAADYDPVRYVAEISQRCVGGEEILAQRKNIQALSDDTSSLLKQNVYQNYTQFIETAKEISNLEQDMYRLSAIITEQRKFLVGLQDTSLLGDSVPLTINLEPEEEPRVPEEEDTRAVNRQQEGRRKLVELMENVEGGREVIDAPTRFLLYDGDLVEMDIGEHTAIHRVHIYLTNDALIVATWLREKRGPVRFKLSSLYPLTGFAMVNVRDLAGVVNAWKLLISPDPRLFQCKDAQSKKEWLAAYEEARNIQKESAIIKKAGHQKGGHKKPDKKANEEAANPFSDYDDDLEGAKTGPEKELELPEWLQELGDILDVHIAQREFETAMEIIKDAEEELGKLPETPVVIELKEVNQGRKNTLVQVLRSELMVTPEKSMQGGPRTARRAVHLLTGMKREGEAKDLFLAHRTAVLRHTVKNCRAEGSTIQHSQRMGNTFFQQIAHTSREFDKCFPSHKSSASPLLMWIDVEVEWFSDKVERQLFSTHTPLPSVCESVSRLRSQARKLQSLGLEVVLLLLDNRLQPAIERLICEARDKAVEAVKLRWGEEKWLPHNPGSRSAVEKCVADLQLAGVTSAPSFLTPEGTLQLTTNSVSFVLSYLSLAEQLLLLFTPGTRHLINESLVSVLHAHLRHLDLAVRSDKVEGAKKEFVMKNASFLLDTVLTLVEHKYQEKVGSDIPKLGKLHSNYSWLKEGRAPQPKYAEANFV